MKIATKHLMKACTRLKSTLPNVMTTKKTKPNTMPRNAKPVKVKRKAN